MLGRQKVYTSVNTGVIVQCTSYFVVPSGIVQGTGLQQFFYTAKLLASSPCLHPLHALLGEYPDQEVSANRMCPCGRGRKDVTALEPRTQCGSSRGAGKGGERVASSATQPLLPLFSCTLAANKTKPLRTHLKTAPRSTVYCSGNAC